MSKCKSVIGWQFNAGFLRRIALTVCLAVVVCLTSCNKLKQTPHATKEEQTPILYVDRFDNNRTNGKGNPTAIKGELANRIRERLSQPPDSFQSGQKKMDTLRYIEVDGLSYQVTKDNLALTSQQGTKVWSFPGIRGELLEQMESEQGK